MIFARKMPEFYIKIAGKIFSRILGGMPPCPPSPTPMRLIVIVVIVVIIMHRRIIVNDIHCHSESSVIGNEITITHTQCLTTMLLSPLILILLIY